MMRVLQLYKLLHKCSAVSTDKDGILSNNDKSGFNPHTIFVEFLDTVTFDPNFLLDLLISNETCFLSYLVQYVRCVLADWDFFSSTTSRLTLTERFSEGHKNHIDETINEKSVNIEQGDPKNIPSPSSVEGTEVSNEESGPSRQEAKESDCSHTIGSPRKREKLCTAQSTYDDSNSPPSCKKIKLSSEGDGSQLELSNSIMGSPSEQVYGQSSQVLGQSSQVSGQSSRDSMPAYSPHVCHQSSPDSDFVQKNIMQDEVMTVLIRLRYSIEKISHRGLFPYNVTPLLRLLEQLEDRYEQ